ncbi:hypothetical protein ATCC90586_003292 [Pythium insidiosum]|nr:hypothetical protein ATCC90586_003292 [Pythium insidiosum]
MATPSSLVRHWSVVRLQLFAFLSVRDAVAVLAVTPRIRLDGETLAVLAQRFPVTTALSQGYTSVLDDSEAASEASPLTASLFSLTALLESELLPCCYRWYPTKTSAVRIEPFVFEASSSSSPCKDAWLALAQRFPRQLVPVPATTVLEWDEIYVDENTRETHCALCASARAHRETRRRRQSGFHRGKQVWSDSDSESESDDDDWSASDSDTDSDSDLDRRSFSHETGADHLLAPRKLSPTSLSRRAKSSSHSELLCRRVYQPVKAFFAQRQALMNTLRCFRVENVEAAGVAKRGTLLVGRSASGVLAGVAICTRTEQ